MKRNRSELEECFELNFQKPLKKAGFSFDTQVKFEGLRFVYDFAFQNGRESYMLEIDGNGMGHSSVKAKARDAEKANLAVLRGYVMLRLTTKHFRRVKKVLVPGEYAHALVEQIIGGRKK